MKERPILFSAPMVRAILDCSKTQTRRIIKPQPVQTLGHTGSIAGISVRQPPGWAWRELFVADSLPGAFATELAHHCPYGRVGDRLWVRETWGHLTGNGVRVVYRADGEQPERIGHSGDPVTDMTWRPSIHMRRVDSRIDLEVTDVRVERLQAITESDARAEGMPPPDPIPCTVNGRPGRVAFFDPRKAFAVLWDAINGDGSFVANPWVWVVSFRRVRP